MLVPPVQAQQHSSPRGSSAGSGGRGVHPSPVMVGAVAGPPAQLRLPHSLPGTTAGPEPALCPHGDEHPDIPKLLYISIHLQATSSLSAVTCNELSNLNVFCIYSCNANVQKKNAAGHSALDLAVAAGDNKVISLFQVSLDREHWTNLWDIGTLFSSMCYYSNFFPQINLKVLWLWEHLIVCPVLSVESTTLCDQPGPCNRYFLQDCPIPFWQFRAQFLFLCDCTHSANFLLLSKQRENPSLPRHKFQCLWNVYNA